MLERAAKRLEAEDPATAARVRLVEAAGEDAPEALDGASFDAVLCHGVLMYLDDPEPLVGALCQLAGPAGVVSIAAKNVEVMALRHAHEGDWAAAIAAFDSERQVNGLGVDTRGDRIDHLSGLIAKCGVEPVGWYGVRLFTDGWTPDRAASDPDELVLEAELIVSQRDVSPAESPVPPHRPPACVGSGGSVPYRRMMAARVDQGSLLMMPDDNPLPSRIYHLALAREWREATEAGRSYQRSTLGRSLDEEGFIHCSFEGQVQAIADRIYRGREDVVLLTIDPARLEADVRD